MVRTRERIGAGRDAVYLSTALETWTRGGGASPRVMKLPGSPRMSSLRRWWDASEPSAIYTPASRLWGWGVAAEDQQRVWNQSSDLRLESGCFCTLCCPTLTITSVGLIWKGYPAARVRTLTKQHDATPLGRIHDSAKCRFLRGDTAARERRRGSYHVPTPRGATLDDLLDHDAPVAACLEEQPHARPRRRCSRIAAAPVRIETQGSRDGEHAARVGEG